ACGVWSELVLFFFSSRRRHTRFSRDWSSDVCSSDLHCDLVRACARRGEAPPWHAAPGPVTVLDDVRQARLRYRQWVRALAVLQRSEERRVGKECRSRRWPYI